VDSLVDKAPEIIAEAAKSPLALTALIVLAVSGMAYLLFRSASQYVRALIFVAVLGSFLTFVLLLSKGSQEIPSQSSVQSAGEVNPAPSRGGDEARRTQQGPDVDGGASSADAARTAEEVMKQIVTGGEPPMRSVTTPFCLQDSVFFTETALRSAFEQEMRSVRLRGYSGIMVSAEGVDVVAEGPPAEFEQCRTHNAFSPQDYVVRVRASLLDRTGAVWWLLVVDRQSGLVKARFDAKPPS
jgi:hypothetical protein